MTAERTADAFMNSNVYFNYAALKRDGVSLDEITQLAGEAALTVPGIPGISLVVNFNVAQRRLPIQSSAGLFTVSIHLAVVILF